MIKAAHSGQFDIPPLVENRDVIVNAGHVYSSRRKMFNIFVKQLMLLTIYLANPQYISRTIDNRRCQHIVEEVSGVAMVVGASTWRLSSLFVPTNAAVEGRDGAQANKI